MSIIIHIQPDVACRVYHFGACLTTIIADEDGVIELEEGRHRLTFVSAQYGEIVQKTLEYETREDLHEDYIRVELKKLEDSFSSLLKVTDEDLEDSISDQYGNLYSKDWARLLRGAYVPYNEIDNRCRVVCDSAFSWYSTDWTSRERNDKSKTLINVILPKGLESIGRSSFAQCKAITEIIIPEKVTYIGDGAFQWCKSLISINIPQSCKVGRNAFSSCPSLHQIVSVNSSSDKRCLIDNGELTAFAPAQIEGYVLPDEIQDIGTVFQGCAKIKRIVLPKNLKKVTSRAFYSCIELSEITIPNPKTIVEPDAFGECSSLETFISANATADKRSLISYGEMIAFAPKGIEKYSIPKGVFRLSNSVFSGCKELRSVFIPDTVVSIGDYAFANSSLREIYLPDSVQQLGKGAFMGCSSLYSVRLSPNIHNIKECVFSRCSMLSRLSFCANPVFISCAICQCPNLQIIEYHSEIIGMNVKQNAFAGCDKLKRVFVPVGSAQDYLGKLPERLQLLVKENPRVIKMK